MKAMMSNLLVQYAIDLRNELKKDSHVQLIQSLANQLEPYLLDAEAGKFGCGTKITGSRLFSEQGLSQYKELQDAYSKFSLLYSCCSQQEYEALIDFADSILGKP